MLLPFSKGIRRSEEGPASRQELSFGMFRSNCPKQKLTIMKRDRICQVWLVLTSLVEESLAGLAVDLYSNFTRTELGEVD